MTSCDKLNTPVTTGLVGNVDILDLLYTYNDTTFELSVFWPFDTESRINELRFSESVLLYIYLNAKVSQLLLKYYFLLFEPNNLLHDIMINKSNDLLSKQHENQTSETYDCRSSTRNVRQPKFEKSQSYNTLHFIESQCYTTLHFIRKRCLTVICFQNQKGRQIQAGYFMHLLTFITST